jgi:uncharacterized protein involved in exopolysaccharide biosynthesis
MEDMQAEMKDINYFKGILRRRRKGFILVFLVIFVLIGAVALLLPPIFESKSTILIENQLIPPEYVQTTITSFVEERLQGITQQIMSRSRLVDIVERFNLYPEMRARYTIEEILDKMREDIKFRTISADVVDRKSGGRPMPATIAFSVSYEGKNPGIVQRVANVLASLYLELNLRSREQRATTTTAFLQQELDQLSKEIDGYQAKISEFKQAHLEELPEFSAIHMQNIPRLERELDRLKLELKGLKERKVLLEGQLSALDPLSALKDDQGRAVMNPQERLKYQRLQLAALKGTFSDKHPDVIRLKKEIAVLESQGNVPEDTRTKAKKIEAARNELALLRGSLGPKHPDVIKQERELKTLEETETEIEPAGAVQMKPDNPAYINIDTQIKATDIDIARVQADERKIAADILKYQLKLAKAPAVEREYNDLIRDNENAKRKYNEIMSKHMEARVSQGMEESQRGERFTIIEPAQLPEKPAKPNRLAILLIGFVLAMGGGVGMAALREALDGSVKGVEQLRLLSNLPVFSVIPYMETAQERRSRRIKWVIGIAIGLAVIVVALIIVDQFVMPLEVLWAKLERNLRLPI